MKVFVGDESRTQDATQQSAPSFQDAGGKVIANEFTHDKATDFFAILTSIKDKNPDFIFFGGMDAVAGPMLRQLKQLDMSIRYLLTTLLICSAMESSHKYLFHRTSNFPQSVHPTFLQRWRQFGLRD